MKYVKFVCFDSLQEALTFQRLYGGWVLEAENGEVVWFRPDYTPSKIFANPLFRGVNGRLRPGEVRHAHR